jgi:tetratricopeptide (TPR) repeat protein
MKGADERYRRAQALAHAALDRLVEEREAFLAEACADDADLRGEVDWLIAAAETSTPNAFDAGADALAHALLADARIEAQAPREYRLLERLGEGGMGQVWLAERDDGGIRRRVALKMLRGAGLPGRRELASFIAEGRILATLQHPNIAHLVDAGAGADGMPFLAMEYVDGEHIDRWCDARGLPLRERIALFLKVCSAVEYAHARLVIHRDLKPPNILVDADGEPKLLDFGIARLLEREAGAAPATTVLHAMTMAYASPEQIEGHALGTATDIYSLGVVLYELLAGKRPFEHLASEHARSNAIVSGEITPPSQRARAGAAGPAGGSRRAPRRIPVDVDAIVLKALRREPAQRYASVGELADDLRHYLAAKPVLARKGQFGYRARRFAWRNRWPLAAASLVVLLATGFTWRTVLAEREARLQAETSDHVADFLASIFTASDSNMNDAARHDLSAREVLAAGTARIRSELADRPRIRARLLEAVGNAYRHMNENDKAAPLLREAADLNLSPQVNQPIAAGRCLEALANLMANGQFPAADAERAARESLAIARRLTAPGSQSIANAWMVLSLALNRDGNYAAALAAAQQTFSINQRLPPNDDNRTGAALNNLCLIAGDLGRLDEARDYCARGVAFKGPERTLSLSLTLRAQARVLGRLADFEGAQRAIAQAIAIAREREGDLGPFGIAYLQISARLLDDAGHHAEALAQLEQVRSKLEQLGRTDSGDYESVQMELGRHHALTGQFQRAMPLLREGLAAASRRFAAHDPRVLVGAAQLAGALIDSGDAGEEAQRLLEDAMAGWRHKDDPGTIHPMPARVALAQWRALHDDPTATALLEPVFAHGDDVEVSVRAHAYAVRATVERRRGDRDAAMRSEREGWNLLVEKLGQRHPLSARAGLRLAQGLRGIGHVEEAQSLEQRLRPLLEAALPVDSAWRERLPPRMAAQPPS